MRYRDPAGKLVKAKGAAASWRFACSGGIPAGTEASRSAQGPSSLSRIGRNSRSSWLSSRVFDTTTGDGLTTLTAAPRPNCMVDRRHLAERRRDHPPGGHRIGADSARGGRDRTMADHVRSAGNPVRRQPLPRRRQAGPVCSRRARRRVFRVRGVGEGVPQGDRPTSPATSISASASARPAGVGRRRLRAARRPRPAAGGAVSRPPGDEGLLGAVEGERDGGRHLGGLAAKNSGGSRRKVAEPGEPGAAKRPRCAIAACSRVRGARSSSFSRRRAGCTRFAWRVLRGHPLQATCCMVRPTVRSARGVAARSHHRPARPQFDVLASAPLRADHADRTTADVSAASFL